MCSVAFQLQTLSENYIMYSTERKAIISPPPPPVVNLENREGVGVLLNKSAVS